MKTHSTCCRAATVAARNGRRAGCGAVLSCDASCSYRSGRPALLKTAGGPLSGSLQINPLACIEHMHQRIRESNASISMGPCQHFDLHPQQRDTWWIAVQFRSGTHHAYKRATDLIEADRHEDFEAVNVVCLCQCSALISRRRLPANPPAEPRLPNACSISSLRRCDIHGGCLPGR